MSKAEQAWFLAERSKALALMHLTRRNDLAVIGAGRTGEPDLHVSIIAPSRERSFRQFGVFLGARGQAVKEADKALAATLHSLRQRDQYPFPVCLFYFTMGDDQGYFAWVAEPEVVEGAPRLLVGGKVHSRKLDRGALEVIVSCVDRWYDAYFRRIEVRAS